MSAVSVYFYLKVLVVLYMHEPIAQAEVPEPRFADLPGGAFGLSVSLLVCTVAVLALGVWPGPITQVAQKAVNGLLPSL